MKQQNFPWDEKFKVTSLLSDITRDILSSGWTGSDTDNCPWSEPDKMPSNTSQAEENNHVAPKGSLTHEGSDKEMRFAE